MNRHLLACITVAASLCCAHVATAADTKVALRTFGKGTEIPASVTLMSPSGKLGRENPIYSGYRPQLSFSLQKNKVTCAIHIAEPNDKVDPGGTAPVRIKCLEDFKVPEDDYSFSMFEGGRKVGSGTLKP